MKIKVFLCGVFAAAMTVSGGFFALAQSPEVYISSTEASGFTVTSDSDRSVNLVAAGYDDGGRLVNAVTMLADVSRGDNTYTYADMDVPGIGSERKIMLWSGEENSIEPLSNAVTVPVEVSKYEAAMQAAVDNGLISGYKVSEINESITKAEIASILVNAMGATEIFAEGITDIDSEVWYADSVLKAVAMGAFELDSDGKFYPESTLTCQEVYTMLAKLFRFDGYKVYYASGKTEYVGVGDVAILDNFADKDTIDSRSVDYVAAIADNGAFGGFDGLLKGKSVITKGEFLYLMDELIGTYIDEPGTYMGDTLDAGKSIIIRKGGVTIDSLYTDRNLIVAYSVDTEGVKIKNSEIIGATVIMGAADPVNVTSCVSIHGIFVDVRVEVPWVKLTAAGAKMDYYKGHKDSILNLAPF